MKLHSRVTMVLGVVALLALTAALVHPVLADNVRPSEAAAIAASASDTNQLNGVTAEMKLKYVLGVTLAIIVFGALIFLMLAVLFSKSLSGRVDEFVRIFAISLVIVASLVLIVAGYDDTQVAPAFGLFGSIIGYIFGREVSARTPAPGGPAPAQG
jgi:hypothetical protein